MAPRYEKGENMKKLLAASMVLAFMCTPAAFAAESADSSITGTTFTEQLIQKHTKKLKEAEQKIQAKQQESEAQQKANQESLENKIQEIKDKHNENVSTWEKKKQEWIQQQKDSQAETEKSKTEFQQKLEKKKQAWKDLLSE